MGHIYEIFLIVAFCLGCFAAAMLLFTSRNRRLLNLLLGSFAFFMSLFFFMVFCIKRGWAPDLVFLTRSFFPLPYFLPGLAYLYVRTFIRDDARLDRRDLLHLAPFALHLLHISPVLVSILKGDMGWADVVSRMDGRSLFFTYSPLPEWLIMFFHIAVILFYDAMVVKTMLSASYRDFVRLNRSTYPYAIRWITAFSVMIVTYGLLVAAMKAQVFFFGRAGILVSGNVVTLSLVVCYDLLIVYTLMNPVILYGMPQFGKAAGIDEARSPAVSSWKVTVHPKGAEESSAPTVHPILPPKTGKAQVEPIAPESRMVPMAEKEKIDLLVRSMNELMESTQPYLDPEFSIEALSESLGVRRSHLTFVFKHVLDRSFIDYKNEFRVNHVKRMLDQGALKGLTMDAIGVEAGFNSRATMYALFKKFTGLTPTEYVKRPRGDQALAS